MRYRVSLERPAPLKVSVKAVAVTKHLPACQRFFFYWSTCSVSALAQHSGVVFSSIYLLPTIFLALISPSGSGKTSESVCFFVHTCVLTLAMPIELALISVMPWLVLSPLSHIP